MKKDFILTKLFEQERWLAAINKGIDKEINRAELSELCSEHNRAVLYMLIRDGKYKIAPPHTAKIPKPTPGEFRTVYINENQDRILLSLINDLLFELCPEMVHKSCTSYQTGIGCGEVVVKASNMIANAHGEVIGWKADLSKYFDSVPLRYVDETFDKVESKYGHSAVLDMVREFYHSNIYLDEDYNLMEILDNREHVPYVKSDNKPEILIGNSLKQGSAVASFLADAILYHIDEKMSALDCFYVRYSDDTLCIGKDYEKGMAIMSEELNKMGMSLNPKKVEYLDSNHWFGFLGYSIKGNQRSLRKQEIKKLQKQIEEVTVSCRDTNPKRALNEVYRVLYHGALGYSWATRVLKVINVKEDIHTLNEFFIDCLRAVATGKRKVGGLGFISDKKIGCIDRGRGKNVTANRKKVPVIDGYKSLQLMQNALLTSRNAYDAIVRTM